MKLPVKILLLSNFLNIFGYAFFSPFYALFAQRINGNITIIEAVWPEYEEFGVSDWTIDRLTARLRTKLKQQSSPYSIVTVKTRGYKMVKE